MRIKALMLSLIFFAAISLFILQPNHAGATKKVEFVGAKKCKICHTKPETGGQYLKWQEAKHSKAFEVLGSDEAKKVASELGIEDPQKSGKCLKCHSTAYHFTEELVTNIQVKKKDGSPRLTISEGVSCESCHGAGSLYQKKKTMKDRELSISLGLVEDSKKMCLNCHNEKSPGWNTEKYELADSSKVGFDFDQAWEKIAHYRPKTKK